MGDLPHVSETEIGDGLKGNLDTIDIMKKVARARAGDPLIRQLALNVLNDARDSHGRKIPSNHFVDEALALGDYVRRKVRYVRDPDNIEYLTDPVDLVKQIQQGIAQGDCDDMALLVATLLLSTGAQPLFRAVRYQGYMGNYNHIYVVVYENNLHQKQQRVVLDCIMKDKPIGFEVPHASGEEYAV